MDVVIAKSNPTSSPPMSPKKPARRISSSTLNGLLIQQREAEMFQRVLQDPQRRRIFKQHLERSNKENCLFVWSSLDTARVSMPEERFCSLVSKYWGMYIATEEPNNVKQFLQADNLSHLKNVIGSTIVWKPSMIDPLMADLYTILNKEFLRFSETKEYKTLSLELKTQQSKQDMTTIVDDVFLRRSFLAFLKAHQFPQSEQNVFSAAIAARSILDNPDGPSKTTSSNISPNSSTYNSSTANNSSTAAKASHHPHHPPPTTTMNEEDQTALFVKDFLCPSGRMYISHVHDLAKFLNPSTQPTTTQIVDILAILIKHMDTHLLPSFLKSSEFENANNLARSQSETRRKSSVPQLFKKLFGRFGKNSNNSDAPRDQADKGTGSARSTENEIQNPTRFEELTKELQQVIRKAGIAPEDANRHFLVILNILHFKEKMTFKLIEDQKEVNIALERQSTFLKEPATKTKRPSDLAKELADELKSKAADDQSYARYQRLHEVGRGGFGKIFKGVLRSGDVFVAIKEVPNNSSKHFKSNLSEMAMLKFCSHPNILKLMDVVFVKDNLWMITEFMDGGSMYALSRCNCLTEKHIAFIAREMLRGISYLHSENLIHRDLKSANVMLTAQAAVKIIDFGLCIDLTEKLGVAMVGSPYWMSPEMIRREPYDFKTDIYSFGVTLMELANGKPPGAKNSVHCMFVTATTGWKKPLEKPKQWTQHFQDFLALTLETNPKERPAADQLLTHEFLNSAATREQMLEFTQGLFLIRSLGVL